jgi:hypothetical protein
MMTITEGFSRAMKTEIERKVAARPVIDYVPGTPRRNKHKENTVGDRRAA